MNAMNNLSSLIYFLPELIIILTLLLVILLDLIPATKPFTFHLSLSAILIAAFCLWGSYGETQSLFMGMIVIDPFSHYFSENNFSENLVNIIYKYWEILANIGQY